MAPDGYENPRGQLSCVGRSLTATFKSRCFGQRHLLGEFLFRNNMVQKVRVEPLKGKGIALDAQVASYDPTRPSATEKFYIATITVAPFSETEMCEVISNVKKSAIWKHLAKYPPCLRGLGVPLLERQQLARVPRQVVEQMAYHWETNVGRYVLKASCDCNDHTRGGWCKHVAALSFELVQWSEVRPLWLLLALGIDMEVLHEEARGGPENPPISKRRHDFDFPPSNTAKRGCHHLDLPGRGVYG